jgi:Bacterial alpha-L-rhamnosidase C-terminal domain
MEHVAGIQITGWRRWRFAPQISGDLKSSQAGFEVPWGGFGVRWTVVGEAFQAVVMTPKGTVGCVDVPGDCEMVRLNGNDCGNAVEVQGGRIVVEASGCSWSSVQ